MRRRSITLMSAVCMISVFTFMSCGNRKKQPVKYVIEEEQQVADSSEKAVGKSFLQIASHFAGAPYKAGTLEHADGTERLTVDTSAFDCMTFVESSMALYRWNRLPKTQQDAAHYREILKNIRYRQGILTDYTSRLHYGSEWIADNVKKGYLRDITDSVASLASDFFNLNQISKPLPLNVFIMTRYPQRYATLQIHPEYTVAMIGIERQINELHLSYIPREMVVATSKFLPDGCIVAITTNIEGLDIAHFGIVCRDGNQPHLLHASSSAKRVVVSKEPLYDYLSKVSSFTGVILLETI